MPQTPIALPMQVSSEKPRETSGCKEEGKVSRQHGIISRKAVRQTQASLQKKGEE